MRKTLYPVGRLFYKKAGFSKVLVVHLTPSLYERLRDLSDKEERSLQVTARRILEGHFEKRK